MTMNTVTIQPHIKHHFTRSKPLCSVNKALSTIHGQTTLINQNQQLPLNKALGRILAQAVYAKTDSPPFDNSAMDGYAIASAPTDCLIRVSQRICAGDPPSCLQPGTAARILTGAPLPAGADTVVIQENCVVENKMLKINTPLVTGKHIRQRGEDYYSGDVLLAAGKRLESQDLALCASSGNDYVSVYQRPRIAIITTGDELTPPGQTLKPGQIYNSNLTLLQGLTKGMGCSVCAVHTIPDNLDATKRLLHEIAQQVDIILTSGGVSSGDEDYLPQAIQDCGKIHFWKLAIKPGKPVLFGEISTTPILALPGNPGAAFVAFTLFGKLLIKQRQGQHAWHPLWIQAKAAFSKTNHSDRDHYLFANFNYSEVSIFPRQGSNQLIPAASCNALVMIPAGTQINKGETIDTLLYSDNAQ